MERLAQHDRLRPGRHRPRCRHRPDLRRLHPGVARQPEAQSRLQSIAILGFALAEALAIIGIALAFVALTDPS